MADCRRYVRVAEGVMHSRGVLGEKAGIQVLVASHPLTEFHIHPLQERGKEKRNETNHKKTLLAAVGYSWAVLSWMLVQLPRQMTEGE